MMRPSKRHTNQMEQELAAGAVFSWVAVKFSFFSASLLKNKIRIFIKSIRRHHNKTIQNDGSDRKNAMTLYRKVTTLPTQNGISSDGHTTLWMMKGTIHYVCLPQLIVYTLIEKKARRTSESNGEKKYNMPEHSYENLYKKITNINEANTKTQNQIWLLHMLLSDLRTLLILYPHQKFDAETKQSFLHVINNILQETPPPHWFRQQWDALFTITTDQKQKVANLKKKGQRIDVNAIFDLLNQSGDGIAALVERLNQTYTKNADIASRYLFYSQKKSSPSENDGGAAFKMSRCNVFFEKASTTTTSLLPPSFFGETRVNYRIRYSFEQIK